MDGKANDFLNYKMGKTLGIGSFGKVKVAEHIPTGHKVAIKILNRRKIKAMDMEEKVRREIKILRLFMHPHIIRLYEVVETANDIFVVMEYVKSGELFDYIVEKGRLQEDEARRFFQQIISGVEYCHRNMVVHRDLKPENLLLDSRCNVKIADFGLSNIMRDGHFLKTSCGSPNYAAPEVISGKLYAGPEVDVWSCGVILYALLCGSLPFDDENIPNLFKKIKTGLYTLPSHLSPGAKDLIPRMLLVEPMKRMTIPEIRQHPWFQAHLPRYLAVPPLDTVEQAKRIDEDILREVTKLGFDRNLLVDSLRTRVANTATVTYYLMLDNRRRMSHGYLIDEFQEVKEMASPQTGPVSAKQLQSPFMHIQSQRGPSPSNDISRFTAERRWALGLQSRASPRDIMNEVLKVLQDMEVLWKKNGNYNVKCRWNSPAPCSREAVGSPMVPGSPIHDNGLEKLVEQQQQQHKIGSSLVKFELQLYKVREEKYLLDLQKLEGPFFIFLDFCGSFLAELRVL
ncbi:SNF1-related protein kinase catalytic subunit alpha KIN10 [Selaginella moellendorffii]|uniref:SNF1-related protein kinase catalytic subunit alpha KIN10 n=1 Tax=Selaginella moellendorffii TaxID=88036 RepID=UPI000D1CF686|nr:SNF1-related protein kinase catalytic subunit alpha KIN10 [Selaginella moellendorffii]|eukprot:XP_024524195.1 SNF1-related protein kinase catalytic subunit alpha KIN10 [Selaginella moellendorffii]